MSPIVTFRSIVTLCAVAQLTWIQAAAADTDALPQEIMVVDTPHEPFTAHDTPEQRAWNQVSQRVGGASAICIPTGATFYGLITAPFLPLPPVQPAPSARVLDNMTLVIDQDKGEWKLVFDLMVHEKTGVLLEWKLAVFDREDGSPLFQFTPAPIKFSAPGIYTRRVLAGPICGCNQGARKNHVNCENVFLDRSRSLVIVLPQDSDHVPFGYDAGCPDAPPTLERSDRPCNELCLLGQSIKEGHTTQLAVPSGDTTKLTPIPEHNVPAKTNEPSTSPSPAAAGSDAAAPPQTAPPPAEAPAPALAPPPTPAPPPAAAPPPSALKQDSKWMAPALGGTAVGLRKLSSPR